MASAAQTAQPIELLHVVGSKEPCTRCGPGSVRGRGCFAGHLPASCEVGAISGIARVICYVAAAM